MTLQEQLKIIQAAIDGKEIEFLYKEPNEWLTKNLEEIPTFNFQDGKYRIKPEPKKEIKLHQYLVFNKKSGHYLSTTGFFPSLDKCKNHCSKWSGDWEIIKVLPHTEITVTED